MEKAQKLAPDSVEAAANLAGLFILQDQPNVAAELLRRFVLEHPNLDEPASRRLMFGFLECGDDASARTLAERVLAASPNDLVSHSVAARCAIAQNRPEIARRHLETVLSHVSDDAGVYFLYGNVLDALGQKKEALAQWQKAIALNPAALDVYERIGEAYWRQGDFRRAAVAFENLAHHVASATTTHRAALALERAGQSERAAYWKAVAAGFMGNFPVALREAQKAAAASDPATRRLGLQAMAEAYRGMRRREPYLATMRKITAAGTARDLLLMAQAWAEVDRHEKRTECLLQALEKAPAESKSAIRYQLAVVYQTRGMLEEAERILDEAIAADPKDPQLHRVLAEICFSRRTLAGRLEKAIGAWETAIALDSDEGADWQHLGVAYLAAEQPLKAVAYLEHAIDLEPGSGPAYQELSRAYRQLNDIPTSQRLMETYRKYVAFEQQRQTLRTRARRERATYAELVAYGDIVLKMGDLNEAAQQFERALLLKPTETGLRKRLAALYNRLRMPDRRAQLEAPLTQSSKLEGDKKMRGIKANQGAGQ
jgi:tetratricopeptide (TPR) repeat protein